jgi:hypothetical protein
MVTGEEPEHPKLGAHRAEFDAFFGPPLDEQALAKQNHLLLSYRYAWPSPESELRVVFDRSTGAAVAVEVVEGAPGPIEIGEPLTPVDEESARNDADAFLPLTGGETERVILPPALQFPRTIWALRRTSST